MNNQFVLPLLASTKLRSGELDFVKEILIILMVLFHLSYFVEHHVALTEWVYTFHMSGFLVISGFLFNAEKDWHGFEKGTAEHYRVLCGACGISHTGV